ncbi:DUF2087 domain-containing protein [Aureimonas frigidaquae]|uniref:DUF2087 domain-containing protein n=1 Tax=Aureimonas frigidaquae TaxID=424757 RepID=UPI000A49E861
MTRHWINEAGKVDAWPRKEKYRVKVLSYLCEKFDADRIYTEKEVNILLQQYHTFQDWALLRRELYERGFLDRDPRTQTYWVVRNGA